MNVYNICQIRWVYAPKERVYEPVFVMMDDYGPKHQVLGRSVCGEYKVLNQRDVLEAPPDVECICIIYKI